MDRIEIYQEIRTMQITYSLHFAFYIILGLEHILFILKIFWNTQINIRIFIICSIIDLIILFYPIIPLILMYRIILRINLTKIFKLLSLILIILSLLIGILINIMFWLNLKSTTSFFRECPYNLKDLKLFINEDDSSERCSKRRCVLESINNDKGYPYNYICNYNSQGEFEIDPKNQYLIKSEDGSTEYVKQNIKCEEKNVLDDLFTDENNKNKENEIYNYLQKCWNNVDIKNFYLCQRYELPNKFNIDENYNCPKDNYNTLLYLSGVFLIILDIFLAFIPWSLDYKSYSRIISFDNNEEENAEINNNENDNERQRRRHNETNTSSNNPNSNNSRGNNDNHQNENNNDNNNENNNLNNGNSERNNGNEFIHQPTETIIIAKDRRTLNNSSNVRSDRLNSGLNSNNISKSIANNSNNNSNINNDNNKKSQIEDKKKINSLVSRSESQNILINTPRNQNDSEDIKSQDKKKLLLNNDIIQNNNKYNNDNEEINFNNNIRYDNEEDEKDEEYKKEQNNCLIQNINLKKPQLIKNEDKINILKKESNSIIRDANNTIITTIVQKRDENVEDTKNNDNFDEINKFVINENTNQEYQIKTPNKELKSFNINFSQVLTNLKESDQISLFKNTNRSIIKEEIKEETTKNKEEEKNKTNDNIKNQNIGMINPLIINNESKDLKNMEENKNNRIIKNSSQGSLLIESSNRSLDNMQKKDNNILQSNLINCTEND